MKAILATVCMLLGTGFASANITITGTGKVTYLPDLALISVGISSEGETASQAWQKNGEIVKRVFEVLKQHGIDPKDFKTAGLNLAPRYVQVKDKEPRLFGYTATYNLSVTVRKLDDLGRVLDDLVENGANRHMGISFGCADPEKLLKEARLKAIQDARKKAELYVTGAGASLGQVVSISEGQLSPWRSLQYEHVAAMKDASLPIATGEQEMTVSVTVAYAINQSPLLPAGSLK